MEADRWLNGRAQFGQVRAFFRKFSAFSVDKDVGIGIFDSGIDLSHPDFASYPNQVSAEFCRNFVPDEATEMVDNTGHGTHCAHVVLQVCEKAKIYVARAFERDRNDTGAASRIPAAIRRAKENEVDIVNMAFLFAQDDGSMFEAISNAGKILFFAAVASERHDDNNSLGYPARFPNVVDVQPCNSQGSPWSPFYQDGEKLVILGEQVEAAFPNIDGVRRKCLSGSPQATSILAGVAGLVMQYPEYYKAFPTMRALSSLGTPSHEGRNGGGLERGRMAGKRSSPSQIPLY
ncbi:hypothetical protein J3459_008236 [Metarhizium acridum]|nr:hypothetical protein J3459_008236 [Metarhizium acridum]